MDLFKRLDAGRPPPTNDQPKLEASTVRSEPAQQLLNFLQRWHKPTVSEREIRIYGPAILRNRDNVLTSTAVLVHLGWLNPNKTRRRNKLEWQIVRKPIVHPNIAAETAEMAGKFT